MERQQLIREAMERLRKYYISASEEGFADVVDKIASHLGEGISPEILARAAAPYAMDKETCFFRCRSLDVFHDMLVPELRKKGDIRVLSVGCCTGQEVWSLLLKAEMLEPCQNYIFVDGIDTKPKAIEEAKSGRYKLYVKSSRKLRNEGWESCLERGLIQEKEVVSSKSGPYGEYERIIFGEINPGIKKRANFFVWDIISDGPTPEQYDTIFCLRLLPHLTPEGRQKAIGNLVGSLESNGYLVCESRDGVSWAHVPDKDGISYAEFMDDLSEYGLQRVPVYLKTNNPEFPDWQWGNGRLYQKLC